MDFEIGVCIFMVGCALFSRIIKALFDTDLLFRIIDKMTVNDGGRFIVNLLD
ncbi:hypothetical protein [Clostridium grantii]|nr:hypothetical protein [Clostridium grantii]